MFGPRISKPPVPMPIESASKPVAKIKKIKSPIRFYGKTVKTSVRKAVRKANRRPIRKKCKR